MKHFAQLMAGGEKPAVDCYRLAYPKAKNYKAVRNLASRLSKRPDVAAEIKRLQKETESSLTLSRQEKREFLARVVRGNLAELDESSDLVESVSRNFDKDGNEIKVTVKMPGKATCIEIDNRMAGHNEPEEYKHTVENGVMLVPVGASTLDEWEKFAAKQQAELKEAAKEEG